MDGLQGFQWEMILEACGSGRKRRWLLARLARILTCGSWQALRLDAKRRLVVPFSSCLRLMDRCGLGRQGGDRGHGA